MSTTDNGVTYARRAPNPLGGDKKPYHPWFQVVRQLAGQTVLVLDFLTSWEIAQALARTEGRKVR